MKKSLRLIIVGILLSSSMAFSSQFTVWNVGQGLWTTLIAENGCEHFDAGGEKAPWSNIELKCARADVNRFHFSHWDQDHIGFAGRSISHLHAACVDDLPAGETKSKSKTALIARLPHCFSGPRDEEELHWLAHKNRRGRTNTNDSSRVFVVHRLIVVSGDSPANQEKLWASSHALKNVRILVLGHHGSKTSTSEFLLDHLPALRQAVASSRRARYGHPHAQVAARLKIRGIALLTTEDWGNITFALPQPGQKK